MTPLLPPLLSNAILLLLLQRLLYLFTDASLMPFDEPTIVFGADVHHPGVGLTGRPSIAAVVASLDSHFARHAAVVRAQEHRKEVIQDLQGAVIELLQIFYQTTGGQKPTRIVFLRDGVSEGQFRQVTHHYFDFNNPV
jgi:eukaryotic translation initiation factor 2C